MKYQLENPNKIELVAGMNLPMLLEIGMQIETESDVKSLSIEAIEIGKLGIYRSDVLDESNLDDDLEF